MMNRLLPFSRELVAVCACLVLGISGCGGDQPVAPVEGILLLDGQPLDNVLVTFVPEKLQDGVPIRSMGTSDAEGQFILRTEDQRTGAVLGDHRVIIEDLAILQTPRSEDGTILAMPPQRFPKVYSDPLRTPLRATVEETTPPVRLELSAKPQPPK